MSLPAVIQGFSKFLYVKCSEHCVGQRKYVQGLFVAAREELKSFCSCFCWVIGGRVTCSPDWPCLCHETQTSLRFLTLLDSSQGLGFIGGATVLSNMKSILIATRVMPGKLEHYIYNMLYNILYIMLYIIYIQSQHYFVCSFPHKFSSSQSLMLSFCVKFSFYFLRGLFFL